MFLLTSRFVDSSLTKERVELGGLPSVNSIIEAFINLKFKKYGQWTRSYLIIDKNGKAIWAHLFYLLRSCKYEESILYAESNSASFAQTDPNFIGYLKSFLTSSFMIPKRARDTLLLFWNNNIRTKISVDARGVWNGGDPFLVACYKIVGRCEVAKRTIPGADIHPTTEDYLWFQLMLIREGISI